MGFYVVFEGIDGAGKTTQAEMLKKELLARGFSVFLFHEPTSTKAGKIVKEMIRKNSCYSPTTISLTFALDRYMYRDEVLKEKLKEYDVIIGDRSFYSSICYQSAMGLDKEWLKEINRFVIIPDLCIVLTVSIETQMQRRGETDIIFEKKTFQEKLIKEYASLKEVYPDHNIQLVDGERSIDEIHEDILDLLLPYLKREVKHNEKGI